MKLFIEFEITRIDNGSIQGEQFDEELQSQVEGIDIEGWEVRDVNVKREKPDTSGKVKFEKIANLLIMIAREEGAMGKKIGLDDEWSTGYTFRMKLRDAAEELTGSKYALTQGEAR